MIADMLIGLGLIFMLICGVCSVVGFFVLCLVEAWENAVYVVRSIITDCKKARAANAQ